MAEGTVIGVQGSLRGQRFVLGRQPITFGRGDDNDVVLPSDSASRVHAELRQEDDAFVLQDRGSRNGTLVNGTRVSVHQLRPGDEIEIGDEVFVFQPADADATVVVPPKRPASRALRVIVSGGGPVGLSLALLLEDLMGPRVDITIYDGRWTRAGNKILWKTPEQGNVRRQQVVTVQSRQ